MGVRFDICAILKENFPQSNTVHVSYTGVESDCVIITQDKKNTHCKFGNILRLLIK